tara:strand:+ start:497 stop:718 length:222 start_codon:yes stop_codon:yes gene_type:complete
MDEWIRNIAEVLGFNEVDTDLFALVILINVVIISTAIYRVVAIKYNLPLPNWIKNLKGGSTGGDTGPGAGGGG